MELAIIIAIVQILVSVLMVTLILMQQKGAGLGSAFGGGDAVHTTRRGPEKAIYNATVILAVLFLGLGLAGIFIS